jgi:hypothetical protein
LRGDQLLPGSDLSEPAKIGRRTSDPSKSSRRNKIESGLDHVLTTGSTQPARTGVSMSWPLLNFGDQESSARLQHSVHLCNRSLSIIIGDVMQGKSAGNGVERIVGERKLLGIGHFEPRRYALLARSRNGTIDHLRAGVNAIDRPARSYPLGEDRGEPARAAADIENMITRFELQIISEPVAHPASASAEQPSPDVVNPGPVDEAVTAVVIGMTGLMHQSNLLGSAWLSVRRAVGTRHHAAVAMKLRGFADVVRIGDS